MDERVKELEDVALIFAENTKDNLTALLEHSFLFEDTKGIHDVRGQAERHDLWNLQFGSLLKDAIKVNMSNLTRVLMNQDVISMTISQSNHVTND